MSSTINKTADDLRMRAEALIAESTDTAQRSDLKTIKELAHELAVHQAELELQNEELLETQLTLQETKDRFVALFEHAPVGYVVLDSSGIIRQANTTWRIMVNREDEDFRGSPFADAIFSEDAPVFLARFRTFFRNPAEKQIIVRMKRKGKSPFFARIEAEPQVIQPNNDADSGDELMIIVSDISDLWEAKKIIEQQNQELQQSEMKLEESLQIAKSQAKEMQLLLEGAKAVLEGSDFPATARRIFDAACEMTGAVSGYVAMLSDDGDENEVLFLESGGLPCSVDESLPMPIRGLRAEAYKTGAAVFDNDFMKSAWVDFMPEGHVELRNVMFAPLNVEGKTVGIMGLANKPENFNENDLKIASAFGQLAAIALKNSRALEAVKESEARYRRLFRLESDAIFLVDDATGQILEANISAASLYEYSQKELLSLKNTDLSAQPDQTPTATIDGLNNVPIRWHKKKSGTIFPVEITATHFHEGNGRQVHIAAIRDISFRFEAEKQLRASEAEKKAILDGISAKIILLDKDLRIVWANRTAASVAQHANEEMVGKPCYFFWADSMNPCSDCPSAKAFQTRKPEQVIMETSDGRVWDKRGEPIFDKEGNVNFVVEIAHDITDQTRANEEKEALQAQLQHARRMEAVGTLAGGIAHDFNNLLQAINGYTQLLLLNKSSHDSDYASLEAIKNAGERAATLIRQLLQFSRKGRTDLKPITLNTEVAHAVGILKRTLPKMVSIEFHPEKRLWPINADPVQIEQILLNLGHNAADAMTDGGTLVIETENVALDEEYVSNHAGAKTGRYALLTVSDTGHGMDEDTLKHIFDPFYTTKEIGKGTGLGLASVYGIVKNHGGYIMCYSEAGQGTTFQIYLPALENSKVEQVEIIEGKPIPRGTETILLVDDEETIRGFARKSLMKFGYSVLTASTGEEALEIYSSKSNEVDLVVMDLGMPGMGGHKCLQELVGISSQVKVVITSGYSQVKQSMDAGARRYVGKPYRLTDLLNTVRAVLDEKV